MHIRPLVLAGTATYLITASVDAAVVVTVQEVLGNVVFEATGSVDLTGLTPAGGGAPALGGYTGTQMQVRVAQGSTSVYQGILSGPAAFGTNAFINSPDLDISGGPVGVASGIFDSIEVPFMYTSGDPISASMSYENETIASLGLIPGSYVWTWGLAVSPDNLTMNIVPEPSTLALTGIGLALLSRRRR